MLLKEAKEILNEFGFSFFKKKKQKTFEDKIKNILINDYKLTEKEADKAYCDAYENLEDYIELKSRNPEFLADKIYDYWKCWKV